MSEHVVIVGPGRMGLALGAALRDANAVDGLTFYGRSLQPPPHPLFEPARGQRPQPAPGQGTAAASGESGSGAPAREASGEQRATGVGYRVGIPPVPMGTTVVLLAVPDSALPEVAFGVARAGDAPSGCVALHLSGAIATDVLAPMNEVGYAVGSLHPLQTVADPWQSGRALIGAAFGLSGEPGALGAGRRLVRALDGLPIVVPPALRARYHAAAVFASNYTLALFSMAAEMLAETGIESEDAVRALLPLARTSLDNIEHLGLLGALTGPIARGDVDTVRLHISRLSQQERALYCGLGRELIRLAREAGLDPARAEELDDLFASH